MTAKFCLLIPAKILQIEKRFPEKLKIWTTEYKKSELIEFGFSDYHLLKLSEFVQQSDVNSDLPKEIYVYQNESHINFKLSNKSD